MALYHDRIGRYFTCFNKVMGESTIVEIVSIDQDGVAERHHFNHSESDAQGALLRLQQLKFESPLQLPKQREEKLPPLFRQLMFLKDYLKTMTQASKPTLTRRSSTKAKPNSFAHYSLTAEETRVFKVWTKQQKVTPTSFLTWTLHKAIGLQSGMVDHACNWSIPVSLRGPIEFPDPTGNHAVPLFLALDSKSTLEGTHAKIQDQLAKGMHWGAYRMLMTLGRLPNRVYEHIIRRDENKMAAKGHWFAVFSNVGAITGDARIASRAVLVPTDPTAPLKGTSLTWNGRMALAVSVHESFSVHSLNADSLIKTWLDVIRSSQKSPEHSSL
ncbi:MAG: hypothetical protein H7249_08405 [Chitinophagaceae bacterium]|nr:hypothetical protein [Oligoflexus sp.]